VDKVWSIKIAQIVKNWAKVLNVYEKNYFSIFE